MQDWENLGRCMVRDRKRKRMTQTELATAAGLTKRSIGNYESGRPPASAPEIPAGYFAVGATLGWPEDGVERALAGGDPAPAQEPAQAAALGRELAGDSALALYPAVTAFARACAREGAPAILRDAFEEAAEALLQSTSGRVQPASYGLAAYRPHARAEGDVGVPDDDAERIRRRLEAYEAGQG